MLPDLFIYESAYPMSPIKESGELAIEFRLPDPVMEKYLFLNAARLLKVSYAQSKSQVA